MNNRAIENEQDHRTPTSPSKPRRTASETTSAEAQRPEARSREERLDAGRALRETLLRSSHATGNPSARRREGQSRRTRQGTPESYRRLISVPFQNNLGVESDLVSNTPLGLKVATYLEATKDIVALDVRMGQLNDGTTYPSDVTVDGTTKKLRVAVKHSGYRKLK